MRTHAIELLVVVSATALIGCADGARAPQDAATTRVDAAIPIEDAGPIVEDAGSTMDAGPVDGDDAGSDPG